MPARRVLFVRIAEPVSHDDHDQAMEPLGERDDVYAALADYNTFPDSPGSAFLYGPGLVFEAPLAGDTISQIQVTISPKEEDYAWPVLQKIRSGLGWSMMDPESGRVF